MYTVAVPGSKWKSWFKDPRTLFTLDGWLEALPTAEFVGIFRSPSLVALSLNRRDNLPIERGLRLWQVYNQRLLHLHKDHPFPLVEFHNDAGQLRNRLQQLIGLLNLPFRHRELTFFEDGLRWKSTREISVPTEIDELYNELLNLA